MHDIVLSAAHIRDWAIIVYCILGAVVFFFAAVLVAALLFAVLAVKGMVKDLVNDSVKPTLNSFKETAESIKGTADFMGDVAVTPIIRTYGVVSGVRRGIGVLTGITRRRRDS
jgi:hypothetical protein